MAQTVFIDLARKARGLSSQVMLGGWLHRRTCNVAATMLRSERRRQAREREAMAMNTQQDHTQTNLARVAPILDEAINQLNAEDRAAIILRFFEQRDFRAVGEALHSSEDAARMRVTRALNKLHSHLSRRGVTLAAGALATGLAAEATTAAPAGLAASIAGTALTSAALGSGVSSTLIRILTMTKMKATVTAAVALAAIATLLVAQRWAQDNAAQVRFRQENAALREQLQQAQQTAWQQPSPEADASELERLRRGQSELLRLRGEVGRLRQELQAATAQSNQPVQAAVEEGAVTNVLSGFTPLQAGVRSRLTSGQTLVAGGWPGHPGERLLVLAVPRITGENGDRVAVEFTAMEMPERILPVFGLDALRTESASSALSTVLPSDQAAALHRTLDEMFQELIKNEKDGTGNEAGSQRETLNCLGLGTVTSTNGQPVSLNNVVAIYGDTWSGVGLHDNEGSGNPIRVRNSDDKVLDLGPYSGPPITATPVILSDRNSTDLSLQATIFKRFDDTP